jgi:hypothetical protein
MLLAILYRDDKIVAAAPACDQYASGTQFWLNTLSLNPLSGVILSEENFHDLGFQTAYASVEDRELRYELLKVGIDQSIDVDDLEKRLNSTLDSDYHQNRAA